MRHSTFARIVVLLTALTFGAAPDVPSASAIITVAGHSCHRSETAGPVVAMAAGGNAMAGHCAHCPGESSSIGRGALDSGCTDCGACSATPGALPVLALVSFLGFAGAPSPDADDVFADIAVTPETRPPIRVAPARGASALRGGAGVRSGRNDIRPQNVKSDRSYG